MRLPDSEMTIPSVLQRAASMFGALEAIVEPPDRVTFDEVATLVDERARAFIASGVEPGDRVALWAPNGLEWILMSFAVYATGAVLVPINTRFKGEEAGHILDKSGAKILLTVTNFLSNNYVQLLEGVEGLDALEQTVVFAGSAPVGTVDFGDFLQRAKAIDPRESARRAAGVRASDISDIIFTSGTTGLPKGVILTHGASVATYEQWNQRVGTRQGDRMIVVYPFFHTAGLKSGVLAAFLRGITLVPHAVFDVESIMKLVAEERISVLPGPPSIFQSILSHPSLAAFDISSLRLSVTGAAVVPVQLIERMRAELQLSVVTAYGLTETHGTATACWGSDSAETIATTVGLPLEGLDIRIVDDEGRDLPVGGSGEILVRGFNVTAGYVGDLEATSAAIVDGWLRTGDIGYLREDGYLSLVDRKKDIYIVGGFNVSSAEIEAMILRCDDVAQVAVVGAPDERLGEVGAAFVVERSGHSVDTDALIEWCREHMANYKVPRHIYIVESLPVNASGKIQKVLLREQARSL